MPPAHQVFKRKLSKDFQAVSTVVESEFKDLSYEELNWKPNAQSWSVGQCLHHLIVSNESYFPMFEQIQNGTYKTRFWERISPFTGFFGHKLLKSMQNTGRKLKVPLIFTPSSSEVPSDIVVQFLQHQEKLMEHLRRIPPEHLRKKVSSPASKFVTYRLEKLWRILIAHEIRHTLQARAVLQNKRSAAS